MPSFFPLVLCCIKGLPYGAAASPGWSLLLGLKGQETITFLCVLALILVQRGQAFTAPNINSPAPAATSPG